MQPRDRRIHLPSHVDIHLRGLVGLVPHERLQRVRRELARVHRGERSAEIVEAIDEGEPPMPMLLSTRYWTERDRLFAAASGPRLRSGFGFPRTLPGESRLVSGMRNGTMRGSGRSAFRSSLPSKAPDGSDSADTEARNLTNPQR